jgi:LysM repeat protein
MHKLNFNANFQSHKKEDNQMQVPFFMRILILALIIVLIAGISSVLETVLNITSEPLPTKATIPLTNIRTKTYVVDKNDTLDSVAKRLGTTPEKIASLNQFPTTTTLIPGQEIVIPLQPTLYSLKITPVE